MELGPPFHQRIAGLLVAVQDIAGALYRLWPQ
jgi:hypothetical protein